MFLACKQKNVKDARSVKIGFQLLGCGHAIEIYRNTYENLSWSASIIVSTRRRKRRKKIKECNLEFWVELSSRVKVFHFAH